jgi:hypothetical protein
MITKFYNGLSVSRILGKITVLCEEMYESQIIVYITMNLRYSLYLYYFNSQKAFY